MTTYRRPSEQAIRTALAAGLPSHAPDGLADAIYREVSATRQRPRPLALRGGLALDARALVVLAALILLLLTLALLLVIGAPRAPLAVSTYHGDAARTGVMPGPGPAGSPRIEWQVSLPGPIRVQPAVLGGVVYVADGVGDVEAVSEATGRQVWTAHVAAGVNAAVAASASLLYVGDESGVLTAFDTATGAVAWRVPTGGPIRAGPVVINDLLLVGSMDAHLYALDAVSGAVRWTASVPGPISRSIAVAAGVIYVPTDGGSVEALDLAGTESWSSKIGAGNIGTLSVGEATLYVPVGIDDTHVARGLVALDLATRAAQWTFRSPTNAMVFAGAVSPSLVYGTAYEDDRLYGIDITSGAERWEVRTGGANANLAALVGSTIYLPSGDRMVYAINAASGGILWSMPVQGTPGALAVLDGRIVFGTDLGVLESIAGTQESPSRTPSSTSLGQ